MMEEEEIIRILKTKTDRPVNSITMIKENEKPKERGERNEESIGCCGGYCVSCYWDADGNWCCYSYEDPNC